MSRWYKRYGMEFIHGTFNLSLEEKGAYSLCLDLIYDRCGPIPDDARWLSGICGVSIRKWNCIRSALIEAGKLTAENGFLSNTRADLEMVSSQFHARKHAESSAKGGRKTAENKAATNKNNDLESLPLSREEEIRGDKNTLSKDNGASANSDSDFWANTKAYLAPHSKNPGALLGKWCKAYPKPEVAKAIGAAQVERAVEPISYIERVLRGQKKPMERALC